MNAEPILADFVEIKQVKTRSVVQLVFEIPIEAGDAAHKKLGGFPLSGESRPCAIVRLNPGETWDPETGEVDDLPPPVRVQAKAGPEPTYDGRPWRSLSPSVQSGILCGSKAFMEWIGAADAGAAARLVRSRCGCERSRSELDKDKAKAERWHRLASEFFRDGSRLLQEPGRDGAPK